MLPSSENCYLLGLILGGGEISDEAFSINLPFNKWGTDPDVAAQISRDLLTRIRPIFKKIYDLDVDYFRAGGGDWIVRSLTPITSEQIEKIKHDLETLGLPTSGQLIIQADLQTARQLLSGQRAELLLSGIFDARASIAESHRRFTEDAPIVSIEIPGRGNNFRLVVQLCSWLTSLGSITDQILYNHPNQHSSKDPEYGNWRKGFKIRILAKSFLEKHSFAMRSFSVGATELASNQKIANQKPCLHREIESPGIKVIHKDIDSPDLPVEVRNKMFLHYFHICAAMGCPFAPIDEVRALVSNYAKYISNFPTLLKGEYEEVLEKYNKIAVDYFSKESISSLNMKINSVMTSFHGDGYSSLKLAVAYLVDNDLRGKRTSGKAEDILNKHQNESIEVREFRALEGAPLFVANKKLKRAAIISSAVSELNQKALLNRIEIVGLDINVK